MFRPVQSSRLHKQVFQQIEKLILDGSLKPGDKLPSERDLSEMLEVSRNSIREALRSLEILGIVECRQGGGNYIKFDIGSGLIEPLSIIFQLHGGKLTDILDARRVLESKAASLAASRIGEKDAQELRDIVGKLKEETKETAKIRLDKEFHFKIAESSGNVLLLAFLSAMSSLLERSIKDGRKAIMRSFTDNELLLKSHERICEAIASRDPAEAAAAMEEHFKMIVDNIHSP